MVSFHRDESQSYMKRRSDIYEGTYKEDLTSILSNQRYRGVHGNVMRPRWTISIKLIAPVKTFRNTDLIITACWRQSFLPYRLLSWELRLMERTTSSLRHYSAITACFLNLPPTCSVQVKMMLSFFCIPIKAVTKPTARLTTPYVQQLKVHYVVLGKTDLYRLFLFYFECLIKLNKQTVFSFMMEERCACLYVADLAIFLTSNSVLGTLFFFLRTACLFSYGNIDIFWDIFLRYY